MENSKVLIKNNNLSPIKLLLILEKTKKKLNNLINTDCIKMIVTFLNTKPLYAVCRYHRRRCHEGNYIFTEKEALAVLDYAYLTEVCGMGYHLRKRIVF